MFDELEVIMAMADYNLNITQASKAIGVSRPTFMKRCDIIYTSTGLNPRDFFDLLELLEKNGVM